MKPIRYKSRTCRITTRLALLLLALGMIGCARNRAGIQIIPLSNRNVLVLNADDVIQVMGRAGFSEQQILEYGPDVRDGLAQSGAVQVRINNKVEAVFAVNLDRGDCVYISTRIRGNFIYSVDRGWVGSGR
ncbi:MAG: hypothetical protein JSW66_12900 [Phycisphaerales bacterium]|nr:MAG: hypothetical protein JSW66_12900 [Phycisphaerales bacterium]